MAECIVFQFDPQVRTCTANISLIVESLQLTHDSLVVLPEFFLSSYNDFLPAVIPLRKLEAVLSPLINLSKRNNLAFVGSLPIVSRGNVYNRGVYLTQDTLAVQDKVTLFGQEATLLKAGSRKGVFLYKDIPFSLQICLDIINSRFTLKDIAKGAQLIINPATVSVDFLQIINNARALEYGVTSIFCNRSGKETSGIQYLGNSSVFFPDGTKISAHKKQQLLTISI